MIVDPLVVTRLGFEYLPEHMRSRDAEVLMLAIGFQESGFLTRDQRKNGPANGFWQFEKGGGVKGVLNHRHSRNHAIVVCERLGVFPQPEPVWDLIDEDDRLASAFARLLLWTDPERLPIEGEVAYAWDYYYRNWRPGKPHPKRWPVNYEKAMKIIHGEQVA